MQRYKFIVLKQILLYIESIYIFRYIINVYIVYYQIITCFVDLYFSFKIEKQFT